MQSDAAVAVSVDEYLPAGQAWLSKEKGKKGIKEEGTSVTRHQWLHKTVKITYQAEALVALVVSE